jgi:hypothetical protein
MSHFSFEREMEEEFTGDRQRSHQLEIHPLIHLPKPHDRMTAKRKRAILKALDADQLSPETATDFYRLSAEEIAEWRRYYERGGLRGLCATKLQHHRKRPPQTRKRDRRTAGTEDTSHP